MKNLIIAILLIAFAINAVAEPKSEEKNPYGHEGGNGGGGANVNGRLLLFSELEKENGVELDGSNIPQLNETYLEVLDWKLLPIYQTRIETALWPTTTRTYERKAKMDPVTENRLRELYYQIEKPLNVSMNDFVLYAVTNPLTQKTYLLDAFFNLCPNGAAADDLCRRRQQAILFHESIWLMNPNVSYEMVLDAEEAYLKNDRLRLFEVLDGIFGRGNFYLRNAIYWKLGTHNPKDKVDVLGEILPYLDMDQVILKDLTIMKVEITDLVRSSGLKNWITADDYLSRALKNYKGRIYFTAAAPPSHKNGYSLGEMFASKQKTINQKTHLGWYKRKMDPVGPLIDQLTHPDFAYLKIDETVVGKYDSDYVIHPPEKVGGSDKNYLQLCVVSRFGDIDAVPILLPIVRDFIPIPKSRKTQNCLSFEN